MRSRQKLSISLPALLWTLATCGTAIAQPGAVVVDRPGSGTNRIEVTGNQASGVAVRCADGRVAATPPANVNSVNIDGQALRGKTVVVTGRNSQDVRVAGSGCDGTPAGAVPPPANVNSVNIR